MALRMELLELKRIASIGETIDDEMATDLLQMVNLLEDICANVNSSELTGANRNLVEAINRVTSKVKANFPAVVEFLNKQIASYEATNETTKEKIDSLVQSIDSTLRI